MYLIVNFFGGHALSIELLLYLVLVAFEVVDFSAADVVAAAGVTAAICSLRCSCSHFGCYSSDFGVLVVTVIVVVAAAVILIFTAVVYSFFAKAHLDGVISTSSSGSCRPPSPC